LGIDSLRYFARARTPEAAAQRIAGEVRTYEAHHGVRPIVFAGFSFGANIGPFIVHDLPDDVRSQIRLAAFLSPAKRDNLEVSPLSWLGIGTGPRVWPALSTLSPTPVLCIGGAGIFSDVCPDHSLSPQFTSVRLEGGHILKGQYDAITALLLGEDHAAHQALQRPALDRPAHRP
jgi:type IV secretory pathway VirJ component